MSDADSVEKAEYLLKVLLFDPSYAAQIGTYDWASEQSRWIEFATILTSRVSSLTEDEARDLTKYLADLGHLDIDQLSSVRIADNGGLDQPDDQARAMLAIFHREGVRDKDALNALKILSRVAKGLKSNFGGRVQKYLRHYGELMLREVATHFPSDDNRDSELQDLFTAWYQRVLNMPVLLEDASVLDACRRNGITTKDLVAAADNLNLSVAVVDELVRLESAKRSYSA